MKTPFDFGERRLQKIREKGKLIHWWSVGGHLEEGNSSLLEGNSLRREKSRKEVDLRDPQGESGGANINKRRHRFEAFDKLNFELEYS